MAQNISDCMADSNAAFFASSRFHQYPPDGKLAMAALVFLQKYMFAIMAIV